MPSPLVEGETVVGEVCHIKSARKAIRAMIRTRQTPSARY